MYAAAIYILKYVVYNQLGHVLYLRLLVFDVVEWINFNQTLMCTLARALLEGAAFIGNDPFPFGQHFIRYIQHDGMPYIGSI